MKKKVLMFVAGAALTASTMSIAAGLTLTGQGLSSNVGVTCNGMTLPSQYDIPANGSLGPLPWVMVYALFHGASTGTCDFFLDNGMHRPVGTATLKIKSDFSSADVVSYQPNAGYKVDMQTSDPTGDNYFQTIGGTLSVG